MSWTGEQASVRSLSTIMDSVQVRESEPAARGRPGRGGVGMVPRKRPSQHAGARKERCPSPGSEELPGAACTSRRADARRARRPIPARSKASPRGR